MPDGVEHDCACGDTITKLRAKIAELLSCVEGISYNLECTECGINMKKTERILARNVYPEEALAMVHRLIATVGKGSSLREEAEEYFGEPPKGP